MGYPWELTHEELMEAFVKDSHRGVAQVARRKLMEYMVIKMKQKWREITGLEFKYDPENTLIDFPGICEAMGMNFEGIEVPA